MTIEEALNAYLLNQSPVTALVDDRIYPLILPQNPNYPAVTYQEIIETGLMAHDGPGDLVTGRYEFDCYALSFSQVKTLAAAVKTALNGYRGMMGTVHIAGIFFVSALSLYEPATRVHRLLVDFSIMYKES